MHKMKWFFIKKPNFLNIVIGLTRLIVHNDTQVNWLINMLVVLRFFVDCLSVPYENITEIIKVH